MASRTRIDSYTNGCALPDVTEKPESRSGIFAFNRLTPLFLLALVVAAYIGGRTLLGRSFPLTISGEAAITIDAGTGDTLTSKRADTLVYPASLTKLMTSLLLAENHLPGDLMTCSQTASLQEPTKLGIEPGSIMTAAAAMDALLVGSANDVAYMVAEDVGGTARDFVAMMNAKAKQLGMLHTNFVTPTGLHDQNHYSTAGDLAALFKAALDNPWVAKSLGKAEVTVTVSAPPHSGADPDSISEGQSQESSAGATIPASTNPSTFTLANTNPLLGKNGCIAGKTGFTAAAGKCLAGLFEKDGQRIIAVVLKSPSDDALADDMETIVRAARQELESSRTD